MAASRMRASCGPLQTACHAVDGAHVATAWHSYACAEGPMRLVFCSAAVAARLVLCRAIKSAQCRRRSYLCHATAGCAGTTANASPGRHRQRGLSRLSHGRSVATRSTPPPLRGYAVAWSMSSAARTATRSAPDTSWAQHSATAIRRATTHVRRARPRVGLPHSSTTSVGQSPRRYRTRRQHVALVRLVDMTARALCCASASDTSGLSLCSLLALWRDVSDVHVPLECGVQALQLSVLAHCWCDLDRSVSEIAKWRMFTSRC
jgi:hypothetical protein